MGNSKAPTNYLRAKKKTKGEFLGFLSSETFRKTDDFLKKTSVLKFALQPQ